MNKDKVWNGIIYFFWGGIFLLSLLQLFFGSTGGFIWIVFLVFYMIAFYKIKAPKVTYLGALIVLLLTIFGDFTPGFLNLMLYHKYFWYDKMIHLISPILFCSFFYFAFKDKVKDKKILIFFSVCILLSFELVWEIFEYTTDHLLGTMAQGVYLYVQNATTGAMQLKQVMSPLTDTIYDMLFNLIGSIVWAAGALFITRKKNYKDKSAKSPR